MNARIYVVLYRKEVEPSHLYNIQHSWMFMGDFTFHSFCFTNKFFDRIYFPNESGRNLNIAKAVYLHVYLLSKIQMISYGLAGCTCVLRFLCVLIYFTCVLKFLCSFHFWGILHKLDCFMQTNHWRYYPFQLILFYVSKR